MNEYDLKQLETRFRDYTEGFIRRAEDDRPYTLKQEHTMAVARHITMLAESIGMGEGVIRLVRAAALVHDLGRFSQFERFNTFSDARSRNHAALGAGEMVRQGILSGISRGDRRLILRAVALHNRPRLPRGLTPELDRLSRLLRDADKIDIYRVMAELYRSRENGSENFITHNLKDDGKVSGELLSQIRAGRSVPYSRVATLNDLKLFQVSMVYDLNFPAAAGAVLDMDIIDTILGSMPQSDGLADLGRTLAAHLTGAAGRQGEN